MKKIKEVKVKKAYICGIAWQHEVGETNVKIYESPKACPCWDYKECGVVEVEIKVKKWVKDQNWSKLKRKKK